MPYFRDSFVPEEGNLVDLPSRVGNKRCRVELKLPGKTENQTKKRSMPNFCRYPHGKIDRQSHECDTFHCNIIDDSNDNKPASTSTSSPQSSVLQHDHHLLSHIPPAKSHLKLPGVEPSSSSPIFSSSSQRRKQPQSTSRDFALEFEPSLLAPSAISLPTGLSLNLDPEHQLSSKLTFISDMDAKKDSHRATTISGSSLSLGSSSKFTSYIRPDKLSRQVSFKSTTSSEIYPSKTEPQGSSLSLGSSSKFNSYIISDKLSRQSSIKSITSSERYLFNPEPYTSSLSNNLFLKAKPEFLPSSQLSRRPTFRSAIDSVINLLGTKSVSKEEEELDTQLSLGSSHSYSKATSSSIVDTHASQGIDTLTSQGCRPIISKLGIPPSQLKTPTRPTAEQKIDLLRQQTKSATNSIDVARIEALAQARIESLRRERQLKEHLKRNKVSSTKAEDLLSQSLRMGRFSIQYAETGEFREKRSRESSWSKNHVKEHFREENLWSEYSRRQYLSSKSLRSEIPTSERSKNLLASQKQKPPEAGLITSKGTKFLPFHTVTRRGELEYISSASGTKEKEKVKEQHGSLQWSCPNLQQHGWSPGDIDLNLGLLTPSISSQGAEKAKMPPKQ